MGVKQSNPNCFKEVDLKLQQLNGYETKIGWLDNEASYYEDGTPVAQVAYWQEFGTVKIPPRPFMRPAQIENQNKWRDTAEIGAKKVLDGSYDGFQAMDLIGTVAEADVLKAIVNVNAPVLSQLTLALRKWKQLNPGKAVTGRIVGQVASMLNNGTIDTSGVSSKPLNDTGRMIANLTHQTTSSS